MAPEFTDRATTAGVTVITLHVHSASQKNALLCWPEQKCWKWSYSRWWTTESPQGRLRLQLTRCRGPYLNHNNHSVPGITMLPHVAHTHKLKWAGVIKGYIVCLYEKRNYKKNTFVCTDLLEMEPVQKNEIQWARVSHKHWNTETLSKACSEHMSMSVC